MIRIDRLIFALVVLPSLAHGGFGIGRHSPKRWPKGVVPFAFAGDLDDRARAMALEAMKAWQERTEGVIRFKARGSETDYVLIRQSESNCINRSPSIGRSGGAQPLYLGGANCPLSVAVVAHELGHAIGLLHEHQRPDRNDHIIVHPENRRTLSGREQESLSQIAVLPEHVDFDHDPTLYGPYDLGVIGSGEQSIMHYGSFDGANGNGPVMVRLSGEEIPNPTQISAGDVGAIREIYAYQAPDPGVELPLEERIRHILTPHLSAHPSRGKAMGLIVGVTGGGRHRFFPFGAIRENDRAPRADDLWEIGSNTKVFTSLILAALTNLSGRNLLEEKAVDLLPELKRLLEASGLPENALKARITLEHLATHYSGLESEIADEAMPRETSDYGLFFEQLVRLPMNFTPGERYEYSNSGVSLLGKALSDFGGKPYATLLSELILTPLGLSATGYSPPGVRVQGYRAPVVDGRVVRLPAATEVGLVNQPTGGLLSSAADMLKLIDSLMRPPEGSAGDAIRLAVPIRRTHPCLTDMTCGIGLGLEGVNVSGTWIRLKTGQTTAFSSVIAYRDGEAGVFIAGSDRDLDLVPLARQILDAVRMETLRAERDALLKRLAEIEARMESLGAQLRQAEANSQHHLANVRINESWMQHLRAQVDQQLAAYWWAVGLWWAHLQFVHISAYYQHWAAYHAHMAMAVGYANLANYIKGAVIPPLRARYAQHETWRAQEMAAAQAWRRQWEALDAAARPLRAERQTILEKLEALKSQVQGAQS